MRNKLFKITLAASVSLFLTVGCDNGGSGGGGKEGGESSASSGSDVQIIEKADGTVEYTGTNGRLTTEDAVLDYYVKQYFGDMEVTDADREMVKEYMKINLEKNIYLLEEDSEMNCKEDGTLEKDTWMSSIGYSIKGNTLSLDWGWGDEPIVFNGSSAKLEGTWTRTKDKATSCRERTEEWCADYDWGNYDEITGEATCLRYETDTWFSCDDGWTIVKAEFTSTNATFTHDICLADEGEGTPDGWTRTVIDCSNTKLSKGNLVITNNVKITGGIYSSSYTYNGQTCTISETNPSTAQMQQACAKAIIDAKKERGEDWTYYYREYYWDNLYDGGTEKDFVKCLKDKAFPEELWKDDDDYYGKALKKSLKSKQQKAKQQKVQALKAKAIKSKITSKR